MNQKSDIRKVVFFSKTTIDLLEKHIEDAIHSVNDGEMRPAQSIELLRSAEKDIHKLFWHLTRMVNHAKGVTRNYRHYHKSGREIAKLDISQDPDYTFYDDDFAEGNSMRVKVNNQRFGFDVPNPSDAISLK
jgi:hypothetical protein